MTTWSAANRCRTFLAACHAALLLAAVPAAAHDPITTSLTWSREISRIVVHRCADCHRRGGASFSLTAYEEARPWAKAIRDEVLERRMPPWGAVKGYGDFKDDPSLSQIEIDMVVNWVEGGAPEGDPAHLPQSPPPRWREARAAGRSIALPAVLGATATVLDVTASGAVEVRAIKPDGSVEPMLWARDLKRTRTFAFREPMRLPKGTRILADGARASISVRSPGP